MKPDELREHYLDVLLDRITETRYPSKELLDRAENLAYTREHAERLVRYARLVGRENVIAGADCGFAASGIRFNDVHPTAVWLKFAALAEGARLATRQLWGRA